jgi:uncharacterized membrane protein YedE/YeeE
LWPVTHVTKVDGRYGDIYGGWIFDRFCYSSPVLRGLIMHRISEFFVGLLFGFGLLLSGMTDPGKVLGFLDLFGAWDPSLALVMGGAIAVGAVAFTFAKKRSTNFFGGALQLPKSDQIDRRLVLGALVFGAGWGLAGFCPGPGLVSMAAGQPKAAVFVVAMMAGMILFEILDRRSNQARSV